MNCKLLISILGIFVFVHPAGAQRMDAGTGTIGLSYTAAPSQSFRDTSGGFGYHGWGINGNIPLFGNRNTLADQVLNGDKPHFYQVSARAGFESLRSSIGFINGDQTIYQASAGLGGLFYNGRKNIILTDLSIGISSDRRVIENNDTRYRFAGLFVVNHLQNASLTWQYGIVFSYAYGRPLPLPVLGVRKKFAGTWTFSAILPVSLQLTDRLKKTMRIGFSIRPVGNRFQLQNQQYFNTPSTAVYMQLRQFEVGANCQYRFAKQFSVSAEAGLLAGGKLRFTEINDIKTVLYQDKLKPGFRGRLTLHYHLPHKKTARDIDTDADMLRLN